MVAMDEHTAAIKITSACSKGLERARRRAGALETAIAKGIGPNEDPDDDGLDDDLHNVSAFALQFLTGEAPQLPPHVLKPTARLVLWWEGFSAILLVYTALVLPVRIADFSIETDAEVATGWDWSDAWTYLDLFVDIFFLLDIARNFRQAYYDKNGHLVSEPCALAKNYLKSWFLLDLGASFPIDWIMNSLETESGAARGAVLLRMAKLGKLLRLVRLIRMANRGQGDDDEEKPSGKNLVKKVTEKLASMDVSVLKHLMAWVLAGHILGCIEFLIFVQLRGSIEGTYIERADMADASSTELYLASVCHAILQLTVVSAGLESPRGAVEQIVVATTVILGSLLLISFVAETTARQVNKYATDPRVVYNNNAALLEQWLRSSKVPAKLRSKMLVYLELKHKGGKIFAEDALGEHLSTPLRQELMLARSMPILRALRVTDDARANGPLAGRLAESLTRRIYLDREFICQEGFKTDGLSFVREGRAHILRRLRAASQSGTSKNLTRAATSLRRSGTSKSLDAPTLIATAGRGELLASSALLMQHEPAAFTIQADMMCEVVHLSCDAYNQIAADFPKLRALVGAAGSTDEVWASRDVYSDDWDCFISHNWGKDQLGRNNHDRAVRLARELSAKGVRCWLDQEEMTGDIGRSMSEGIEKSRHCLVLLTQSYMTKVQGHGPNGDDDNCKFEYDLACLRVGAQRMLPVVMEPDCKNPATWAGKVGGKLGTKLYTNCSSDAPESWTAAVATLMKEMGVEDKSVETSGNRQQRLASLKSGLGRAATSTCRRFASSTLPSAQPSTARERLAKVSIATSVVAAMKESSEPASAASSSCESQPSNMKV